ncbi:DNA/RNA helicase domain-containing protein [Enterococcus durans]|uniref:DNA/RNA helicase domain-containing protein n=1 Tax=Enterococcus durans TaxID=53345 RepID=UPI001BDB92B9
MKLCEGKILNDLTKIDDDILINNPVTYIYFNLRSKIIYIGETSSFKNRHKEHLAEKKPKINYQLFTDCLVIYSKLFHKSAILYLESLLLNYMIAEADKTKFVFANGNNGQTKINYENKEEILTNVFYELWTHELSDLGLVNNQNLNELRESLLFKYSPFKQLSLEQKEIIGEIERNLFAKFLVEAPAGSGKSVLFTSLAFSLADKYPDLKIGVVTTGNLIRQFNLIFKSINLSSRLTVKTGSQLITDAKKKHENFDIIIVDEAHKLKKYYKKGHPNARRHLNKDDEEITLLEEITKGLVLLYDPYQGIKPQNISPSEVRRLTNNYQKLSMSQQFRIGGKGSFSGEDYLKGILYGLQLSEERDFNQEVFKDEYFGIVNSFKEVIDYVDVRSHAYPETTNRVIAGYCREWISSTSKKFNKGKTLEELPYDWEIDGIKRRWNSTYEDWVKKPNSEREIGSIHAIQGYDLNYSGVIIGNDITVKHGKIVAVPENYKDIGGTPLKKEFSLSELTEYILNIYYVLLSRGIDGCRVYFEDKKVEKLFRERLGL